MRRLARDEAIVVVSNQRPIWTKRWWWSHEPREASAYALGQAKVEALPPAPKPAPSSTNTPRSTPPKPTLRDLKAKLQRLGDDDLGIEDLPDDFGR